MSGLLRKWLLDTAILNRLDQDLWIHIDEHIKAAATKPTRTTTRTTTTTPPLWRETCFHSQDVTYNVEMVRCLCFSSPLRLPPVRVSLCSCPGTCFIHQTGLELTEIHLPECWDQRCVPPLPDCLWYLCHLLSPHCIHPLVVWSELTLKVLPDPKGFVQMLYTPNMGSLDWLTAQEEVIWGSSRALFLSALDKADQKAVDHSPNRGCTVASLTDHASGSACGSLCFSCLHSTALEEGWGKFSLCHTWVSGFVTEVRGVNLTHESQDLSQKWEV